MTFQSNTHSSPIALVTGASSGIGAALCKNLVKQRYRCIGISRTSTQLHQLQAELGPSNFHYEVCDIACPKQVQQVSARLQQEHLIPSLFFLNAGIAGKAAVEPPLGLVLTQHHELFAVNYFGVLSWIQAWQPICLGQPHSTTFLVTSSINAIFAPPQAAAYAASKAAIAKAFESLDLQYSQQGLRFLTAYPGPVKTPGLQGSMPFTWTAERAALKLIAQARQGRARYEPAKFYSCLCRLLRHLPYRLTHYILGTP